MPDAGNMQDPSFRYPKPAADFIHKHKHLLAIATLRQFEIISILPHSNNGVNTP
jgi:hypothetical protein